MPILTGDFGDLIAGAAVNATVTAYVETNVEANHGLVDTTNNMIRLGKRYPLSTTDGAFSVDLPSTDATDLGLPAGQLQYQVVATFTDPGSKGKDVWRSGWFFHTAAGDLSDKATSPTTTPPAATTDSTVAPLVAAGSTSTTMTNLKETFARGERPTYAADHPGVYDHGLSVYNLTPATTHKVRAKVASAVSGRVRVAAMGHSMLAGSNATPGSTDMPRQLHDLLDKAGVPIGGAFVYLSNREGLDSRWALSAGWYRNTLYDVPVTDTNTSGETATFTSQHAGTAVDIAYWGTSAAFTYSIDGGAAVTVTPTGAAAVEVTSVTGLPNTTHTIVLTTTVAGTGVDLDVVRGSAFIAPTGGKFGDGYRSGGVYGAPGTLDFLLGGAGVPMGTGTLEGWVRKNGAPASNMVAFGRDQGVWVGANPSGQAITFVGAGGGSGTVVSLTGNTNICDNQWHHVAVVLDAGKPSLYVDGTRQATSTTVASPSSGSAYTGCCIGGFGATGSDWVGDVDEVRISDNLRYTAATYTTPTAAWTPDANTKNLWHLDGAVADAVGSRTYLVGAGVRGTSGLELINAGRGGSRTQDWNTTTWNEAYQTAIAVGNPDVAILQLDTNDGRANVTPADMTTRYGAIISALQERGTAVVLVASPSLNPGGTYGSWTQAYWESLVEAQYDLADTYGVPLIDATAMFIDNATADADGLMGDDIHPNAAGYRRIAQTVARVLTA